jgi:5-methylcytosine-specific restriction enzyme A
MPAGTAEKSAGTVKPRSIPPKVRARVLERDGYKCRRCGAGPEDGPLEVDHITPVAEGGSADESNLQTLCRKCNKGKGADAPTVQDQNPLGDISRDMLAAILGVDVRTITNCVNDGMPKSSRGRFPLSASVQWFISREREKVRAGKGLNDLDIARQRHEVVKTRIAERELETLEGSSIPTELHESRLRERLEQVAGAVKALGRYQPDVKAAITDESADALLDRMSDEILAELSGLSDTIE